MLNRNWVLFWLILVLLNGYFAHDGKLIALIATVTSAMCLGASLVIGKDYWR